MFIRQESSHDHANKVIRTAIETGKYRKTEIDGETVYVITGITDFGNSITGHVGVTRDAVYIAARSPKGDFDEQQARNLICQKNLWQKEALGFADTYVLVPPAALWRQLPLAVRQYLNEKMNMYFMIDPPARSRVAQRIRITADKKFPCSLCSTAHVRVTTKARQG